MVLNFKVVTITLKPEALVQFKTFCKCNHLPLSRFLSYAGLRFIQEQKILKE